MYLLSISNKTNKTENSGLYLNRMMYLEPNRVICPSSGECMKLCLKNSGNMKFKNSRKARIARTKLFFQDRDLFLAKLDVELKELKRFSQQQNKTALVRLNGTSDIDWIGYSIIKNNPQIEFYDYTKRLDLYKKFLLCKNDKDKKNDLDYPDNYHLIYSFSEKSNLSDVYYFLKNQGQVAIVFSKIPKTWKGFEVIDGDKNDLRIFDKTGVIIGLKARGKAIKNNSLFVQ